MKSRILNLVLAACAISAATSFAAAGGEASVEGLVPPDAPSVGPVDGTQSYPCETPTIGPLYCRYTSCNNAWMALTPFCDGPCSNNAIAQTAVCDGDWCRPAGNVDTCNLPPLPPIPDPCEVRLGNYVHDCGVYPPPLPDVCSLRLGPLQNCDVDLCWMKSYSPLECFNLCRSIAGWDPCYESPCEIHVGTVYVCYGAPSPSVPDADDLHEGVRGPAPAGRSPGDVPTLLP